MSNFSKQFWLSPSGEVMYCKGGTAAHEKLALEILTAELGFEDEADVYDSINDNYEYAYEVLEERNFIRYLNWGTPGFVAIRETVNPKQKKVIMEFAIKTSKYYEQVLIEP